MKDVMNASARWQLKTVCERADALQHQKGAHVARTQLALGARVQGLRSPVQEAQPHPIAHRKLRLTVMGVELFLGHLLGLEKTLTHLR
jgi:hypothetical protein